MRGKSHTTPTLYSPRSSLSCLPANFEWIELQMVNKHWKIWRVLKRPIWVWNRKCFSDLLVNWGSKEREVNREVTVTRRFLLRPVTSHGTACLSFRPPVRLSLLVAFVPQDVAIKRIASCICCSPLPLHSPPHSLMLFSYYEIFFLFPSLTSKPKDLPLPLLPPSLAAGLSFTQ